MNDQDEMFEAATEEPIGGAAGVRALPNFPSGFDGTEEIREDSPDSPDSRSEANAKKNAEYFRRKYSFCDGLFPIHFVNTEDGQMASCWIGGRHFTLKLDLYDGKCTAVVRDNGKAVFSLMSERGKEISGHVAYAAFKEYVRNISGCGKYHSRGGFLKQAAMKHQAHDNKQEGQA